jgi:hypothetical protein
MFDLVSTRASTDPATRGCAQLLAAVICGAVRDACAPLDPKEVQSFTNLKPQSRLALRFLFSRRSVFGLYAELIGCNADTMREALLSGMRRQVRGTAYLTEFQMRCLRTRLAMDQAQPIERQAIHADALPDAASPDDVADDIDDTGADDEPDDDDTQAEKRRTSRPAKRLLAQRRSPPATTDAAQA